MSLLDKVKPHVARADILDYTILLSGVSKSGKTTLAYDVLKEKFNGDLSKGLFIAFEQGYRTLQGVHAFDITSWRDAQTLQKELIETAGDNGYKVLILDTLDLMEAYIGGVTVVKKSKADKKRYESVGDIDWGVGYQMVADVVQKYLNQLEQAGYSLWLITHTKEKTFTSRSGYEYNQTITSLSNKVADVVKNMADFMIVIDVDKEKNEDGELEDVRKIYFRGNVDVEAGSRFPNVPDYILYDSRDFIEVIENAIRSKFDSDEAFKNAKKEQTKERQDKLEESKQAQNDETESNDSVQNNVDEEIDDNADLTDEERLKNVQSNLTELGKKLPKDKRSKGYVDGMPTVKDLSDGLVESFGTANYLKLEVDQLDELEDFYNEIQDRYDNCD